MRTTCINPLLLIGLATSANAQSTDCPPQGQAGDCKSYGKIEIDDNIIVRFRTNSSDGPTTSVLLYDKDKATYYFADSGNINSQSNGVVGIGYNALSILERGDLITAIGQEAMGNATTPGNVVAIGAYALRNAQTVIDTVAVGNYSFQSATAGVGGTSVGHFALQNALNAGGNTAIGDSALRQTTTGIENTALGYTAADANISGSRNVDVGYAAGRTRATGDGNVTMGYLSGWLMNAGSNNVLIGRNSAEFYHGDDSVAVGAYSLQSGNGAGNVGIGYGSGANVTIGSRNTFVGFAAGQNIKQVTEVTNSIAIGALTYTTKSNQLVLGNNDVDNFVVGGVEIDKYRIAGLAHLTISESMSSTALGVDAQVGGTGGTAVGFSSIASNVNTVAIGSFAQATASNSVSLGSGSVADQANTVSVGAAGAERRITNVGAGTGSTDAVNKGQLDTEVATRAAADTAMVIRIEGEAHARTTADNALASANTVQDQRLTAAEAMNLTQNNRLTALEATSSQLGAQINLNRREANGGTAAAMAMGGAMIIPDANVTVNFNLATYRGQQGYSGSVAGRIAPRTYISAGVAGSTVKDSTGARIGVAFGF